MPLPISPANLDPAVRDLLRGLQRLAQAHDVRFFVCGAYARDLILEGIHGVASPRITRDVDLAIAVPDWATYDRIFDASIAAGILDRIGDHPLKFRVRGTRIPVDVIVFGGIEAPNGEVRIPPDRVSVMTVTGFADVTGCTIAIDVGEGVEVGVTSLHGLAILKLIAWRDRGVMTAKDAIDIAFLLNNYGHPVMIERLHADELPLLAEEDFNLPIAGARLLGRDMAHAMSDGTARMVADIVERELEPASGHRLAIAMSGRDIDGARFEQSLRLLDRLLAGLRDPIR